MNYMEEHKEFFEKLLTMLEEQYGPDNEIVLHDLTKPYDNTIIDIRNGHVTNRKIGGCGSNLGLEVLKGTVKDGDQYNYITYLSSSRIIRSSSMYMKNPEGEVVGCLCINTDITETVRLENLLKNYNKYSLEEGQPKDKEQTKEVFVNNVHDLLEHLIAEALAAIGKTVETMNKEDKMEFLSILDKKGAFLIAKSSEKICGYLGISKFTLYKYLDAIRTEEK